MTPTHNSTNHKQSAVEAKQTGCTIKNKTKYEQIIIFDWLQKRIC